MVKMLEELKKRQNDKPKINASTTPVIKSNMELGPAPLKRRLSETSRARMLRSQTPANNPGLLDINQERAQMEASREQISPKNKLSKPPGFSESPKEDKENEQEKRDGFSKDDSGTESDIEGSSEEDSEEDSEEEEEEETTKPTVNSVAPRAKVTVNSVPSKPTVNSLKEPEDESESEEESGSETEASSEEDEDEDEEEEEPPVKPESRTSSTTSLRTISTTRAQSAPFSTSNSGVGGSSRLLKSPFIDNDKKASSPSSPVSKTEPSRFSRLTGREESKEEPKSRFGSYPTRTTASTTSNTTSTTTTSIKGRTISTPSEDTPFRGTRAKRPEDEEEIKKSNDVTHRRAGGDDERKETSVRGSRDETKTSTRPYSTTDSFLSRRNKISGTGDEKNEPDGRSKQPTGKNNEEVELPAWKRRLQEREKEREREREKEKEKEQEREREREKQREKERESEMPSYRRSRLTEREREKEKEKEKDKEEKEEDDSSLSAAARAAARRRRLREKRRAGSDEDETEDVKRNDTDEKAPGASRRRSQETRAEDAKSITDRIRASRTDAKGPFGTSKANAIAETDPQKLKERLQETQLEVQEYKIKLEKALQAKEELERKYANVEEDLKQLSDLKADNQRLKDENGALIRVISKLSRPPT
ncbi:protein phosphatase 1 regulatory subunit 12A-like isoform X1 [Montipora foliosa]|uniref:protein phosphatase 1 regulatory subunit 12A-like isoform X1 n=1 Tax=Montipora foliosa TaxID=591990 RepID=UPI0035F1D62B